MQQIVELIDVGGPRAWRQAATEYALLSALFGLTRSLAGGVSGFGTARLGYPGYFFLTFILAFPAYALLPWVRRWVGEGSGTAAGWR